MQRSKLLTVLPLVIAGSLAARALPAAQEETGNPVVAASFAPDGRLWRVRPGKHNLQVDYSTDLGASFSSPVLIQPPRQRLQVDPEGAPQIAVDTGGTLYVAWNADARSAQQSFVVTSRDNGRTFSAPFSPEIPGTPTGAELRPLLLAHGDRADLYFLRPEAAGKRHGLLYRSVVAPGVASPPAAAQIAGSTCECCRLAAARDTDGSVVLLSRMVFDGGIRDFGIIRVSPAGQPSPVLRATDDDWQIDACPEHGGALSIAPDGRYHLTWFTQGRKRKGLFYAFSSDRGTTWSAPLRIGNETALAGHADVLALQDQVYLAWQQFDGTRTSVLAMSSGDSGRSWTAPRELASTTAAADYPRLVANDTAAFVSWSAGRDGYRLLPLEENRLRSFVPGSAATLVKQRRNDRFLLVLWSVDCAPCLREFEQFKELRRQGRHLPLLLVATDGLAERDRVTDVLARFGLQDVENWIFADENPAKLRFEIDPAWYGEMPRSYFYANGQRQAISGGLSAPQITAWLDSTL
ncbi:MAG: hypothetical protein E4H19_06945 [Chromatiales bacterium]|nr:MAG: hypothetical protein E4H19_06945 [Chromatiales bacterium]